MPFTLDTLASALRGIPRDAVMLVRLTDGSLRQIDRLEGATMAAGTAEGEAPTLDTMADGERYAVVMMVETIAARRA